MIASIAIFSLELFVGLAAVFQDSMVLQRDVKVPIWGTAVPGERVIVGFAGQTKRTVADAQGKWRVNLDPMRARSTGTDLTVQGHVARKDILVGEVWIAAGQSNMEWPLRASEHGADELAKADRPQLRIYNRPYAGQNFFFDPFDSTALQRMKPDSFFGGSWQVSNAKSAAPFSAVAYTFARVLQKKLEVPVGIINLGVGGSPAEAWLPRTAADSSPELAAVFRGNWMSNPSLDDWCRQRGEENLGPALRDGSNPPGDELGPNHPFKPGFLFQAGIEPLIPMAFRGAIWYQGESNALSIRRVNQHAILFPALVKSWRAQCGRDFPFYYCQLSSMGTEEGYQSHAWPEFRDQQRRFLETIPNTGMAVTSDHGHLSDVHPRNKRVVGERLALWALAKTYGRKIEYSGPSTRRAVARVGAVEVEFDHVSSGLAAAGELRGFEMAGSNRQFKSASAEIRGKAVVLRCPEVKTPEFIRYGWRPFTDANLTNGVGLPASTFQIEIANSAKAQRSKQMEWQQLPNIPDDEGFASPFAGVSHGSLLVGGGANFPFKRPWEGGVKIWYIDVFALDKPDGEWRVVGKLPRKLGYGVSATYQDKMFCVGGSDADRHYTDAFSIELKDGRLETKDLPPLPLTMANGCGAVLGSNLLVFGGQGEPTSANASRFLFVLDLAKAKSEWHVESSFPGAPRILATCAVMGKDFYVMGGAALNPDAQGKPVRTYLKDAYRYRLGEGWKRIADLPHPVVAAPSPAPTTKDAIYILGGDDGSRVGTDPKTHPGFPKSILRYDVATDKWSEAGQMPVSRVTVPTTNWKGKWIIPNGEQMPGIRSPEVWSVGSIGRSLP